MKVKEYLVNRILELEHDLKKAINEKAGTAYALQKLQEEVIKLNEKIDQYLMEREHIKEIITCNIGRNGYNHLELKLQIGEKDFDTLQAILNIKPEDYEVKDNDADKISTPPPCWGCKHEELDGNAEPCFSCFNGDHKEVTANAENTD